MSPLSLPRVGLGTYSSSDRAQWREVVRKALEMGYRHVDTAQSYGNERYVGDGLAAAAVDREAVTLATKVSTENLAHDDVLESTRASLDRLGVEYIDLLYVHWPTETYDPASSLAAFQTLIDDGLIRHIGVSNFEPRHLDRARDVLEAPVVANQVECHPFCPQERLREYAARHDHQLVAYSPLAKGRVLEVPAIRAVAERHRATPAQVALAWLAEKGVAAIPKASTRVHLQDNLEATDLRLDADDVARIDAIERRERVIDPAWAPWR